MRGLKRENRELRQENENSKKLCEEETRPVMATRLPFDQYPLEPTPLLGFAHRETGHRLNEGLCRRDLQLSLTVKPNMHLEKNLITFFFNL